jgi:Xaa-Pro aminopeptidase
VEAHRIVKDALEIEILRRAARLLSDVARDLQSLVAAGRTEREVARAIEGAIETAGFSAPAFPTIVASGPHSARPHARPTDRRLQPGDLVVLDFGGVLDGYCGDLTRTAAIGPVSARAQALYEAVREAHAAAIAAVRPGVLASDVDAAARASLASRGVGEAFLHGTGHGLGLDLHEAPRLGRPDADRAEHLAAGMVCTIEPGVYVEGTGGVRLEDDVLVTAEGCEVLTDAPRELLVL